MAAGAASSGACAASASAASANGATAAQAFLAYMKETPAQQLEDQWLAAHHLTRKALDAMPAKQREAIMKEIEADIKRQLKQAAEKKTANKKTGILV